MAQTISEYKLEGAEKLNRYKQLLNKNQPTANEIKELEDINRKFGEHPLFARVRKDNYDRRAVHSGFGAPNCSCHISPPCQSCVDWTNYCDERQEAVEIKREPGCVMIGHDCEVARNPA